MSKTPFFLSALLVAGTAGAQCKSVTHETSLRANAHDIVDVAVEAGTVKNLVAAVQAAGLETVLRGKGPFTVFAPTDAAFAKLADGTVASLLKPENRDQLKALLTYHVVAGKFDAQHVLTADELPSVLGKHLSIHVDDQGARIAGARIVKTDIEASNGLIHVVDSVLMPPSSPDIVELAAEAGTFRTLLRAAKAAGLVDALRGDGPLTVLAPTDAAFAKLGEATLAQLLLPANKERLATILKAHVVSGEVSARDAVTLGEAKSLAGEPLEFAIRDGRLVVNGANIVKTDLDAKNGIVHVIDTVIVPR
ncbi:MAG: fasciclin domain-containing protein [Planctomycetes bacterium]|nr:fasciclin domain-containing protein [Planctomycetota bacterium]